MITLERLIDSGGTYIELWVLSWPARLLARCPLDQLDPPPPPLLPACHTWWINPLLMINTPSHIPHLVRQFVEASGAWSTSSSTIIASAWSTSSSTIIASKLGFPSPWWICACPSIPTRICIAASDVREKSTAGDQRLKLAWIVNVANELMVSWDVSI